MMDAMPAVIRKSRASTSDALKQIGMDKYDVPAFLRKQADLKPMHPLLALIEDDPTRLDRKRALDLLREAGIESDFHDLFRHAADLGLNVDVIAAIVLAALLRGPLGEFLSAGTQGAIASLQDYAKQATEVLRELGRRGVDLEKVIGDDFARDVLSPGQAQVLDEALECVTGIRDLLDHVQHSVERSIERIKADWTSHAQRDAPEIV